MAILYETLMVERDALAARVSELEDMLQASMRETARIRDPSIALAARVKELEAERDDWKHAAEDRQDNIRLLKQSNNSMFAEFKARVKELEDALEPFAEFARLAKWPEIPEDNIIERGEHLLETRADVIAQGAIYCLMVSHFIEAAAVFPKPSA